jgi:hypothetical protein
LRLFDFFEIELNDGQNVEDIPVAASDLPFFAVVDVCVVAGEDLAVFVLFFHHITEHLEDGLFDCEDELVVVAVGDRLATVDESDVVYEI